MAGNESVGAVANTGKGVLGQGFRGVNKIGRSVTGHANYLLLYLLARKSQHESSHIDRFDLPVDVRHLVASKNKQK